MPQTEVIPGLEGIAIAESSISFVDGQAGRLEYRGIGIDELAEHGTFEETTYLLLFGKLPTKGELASFNEELIAHRALKDDVLRIIRDLPKTGHPMEALQAAVAAIGMFYSAGRQSDEATRRLSCLRLVAKMPVVVAAFTRFRQGKEVVPPRKDLSHAANFLYMLTGEAPNPDHAHIMDVALILHADHTMNASTFSGRVVGSTLTTPYSVVSSALGALYGPLHGGANEDVMDLLDEIGTVEKARPTIQKMIETKKKIPGFGHRVYKTMDPRAKILKHYASRLAEQRHDPIFDIAVEVEKAAIEAYGAKGIWPNVDFFSGIVYREIGFENDNFTPIFAVSRVSGWLAHWLEQLQGNRIFRPTQKYVGKHNEPYVPIAKR
jgi:citrate synthase